MFISAVISVLIFIVPAQHLIIGCILMLLAGFFVYGPQACFWPLSPDMLGDRYTGTGIGFMNMCGYVFAAFGEPLLGYVIDVTGSSKNIFIVIAITCFLSSIIVYGAGRLKTKLKLTAENKILECIDG